MSEHTTTREKNRAYLPPAAQGRIEACGQPMRLLRQSGEVEATHWRCEHRFCASCARQYSWRVASALRETFDETDVYMLTLTQRLPAGNTAKQLRENWETVGDHWKRATARARRHCRGVHKRRRHELDESLAENPTRQGLAKYWREYWDVALSSPVADEADEAPSHAGTAALPYLGTAYSRTWCRERGEYEAPEELTYVWVREVTRGDAGQWHVHVHVICPDRATAEVLNAAWQATRTQGDPCRTDIETPHDVREELEDSEGEASTDALAEYVTQYVTGARDGAFTDEWSTAERSAYVRGMADRRVYDAAGDWRPIGLRTEADEDDPAVAVAWSDLDVWEGWRTFWSDESTVRETMQVAANNGWAQLPDDLAEDVPTLEARRQEILEQQRHISEDPPDNITLGPLDTSTMFTIKAGFPRREREPDPPEDLCGC